VSKSTVSRICAGIDEEVAVFRTRRLDHVAFPYVYLDATYIKARINHRIISRAVVVATGVTANGTARCSASTSATARTRCSGPRSCAA
jgi:putative transposase